MERYKPRFLYKQSEKDYQWYWHLIDGNQLIIADGSEGYKTEDNVIKAIRNVQEAVLEICRK